MHILKIIPATKIPLPQNQILTYFSIPSVLKGSLVMINLRNKKVLGAVVASEELRMTKMDVRKSEFSLKKIEKIIVNCEVIDDKLIELFNWISPYYWESLGVILKTALPKASLKKWQELVCPMSCEVRKDQKNTKEFYSIIPDQKLFNWIESSLKKRKQALVLYPEIAKLETFYQSLPKKLQEKTIVYHSEMKNKDLWENWKKIHKGNPYFILSTRQGIFLPYKNLDFILIRDEESLSYKSWDQHPKINAKHIAFKLAEIHQARIILESTSPSLEAYWNIQEKRYVYKTSVREKVSKKLYLIDMRTRLERSDQSFSYLSPELIEKVELSLSDQGKVLMLQNRRGSATYIFCQDCGYFYECPFCRSSLVYHQHLGKLTCHWCGHKESPAKSCRKCHGHRLKYAGHGTEKIFQELKDQLPASKIYIIDNDNTPTYKDKLKVIQEFEEEEKGAILISTVALLSVPLKKFNLACFLNFDLLLNFPDFSTNERTLQFFRRITNSADKIFIQSYNPEDEFFKMLISGQYDKIYAQELLLRKKLHYPPYWQVVTLRFRHRDEKQVEKEALKLFEKLKKEAEYNSNIQVLGPLLSLRPKIKASYYRSIVLKVKKGYLKERNKILSLVPAKWDVDVDAIEI